MKTSFVFLGFLLSLLLLLSFCHAAEKNMADLQLGQGAAGGGVATKNGEEDQEEKFKFLHHHKPLFKKPFLKPAPFKHPFLKKPIPGYPFLKKPFNPPVFPGHP